MSRLRTLGLIALAGGLLATAGCGGGGSTDRVSGLTPDEILRQSSAAADGLTAFTLTAEAAVQADVAAGSLPKLVAQALTGSIGLQGTGPVNGGSASFDFDARLTGLPAIQGNITKVDGALYVGVLGTDYKVALPAEQVESVVPAELPGGLLAWATAPAEVGRETIDGTRTVHLTAAVDVERALGAISGAVSAIGGSDVPAATLRRSATQLRAALTEQKLDLWIGIDDLIPRRVTARLRFDGKVDALPQVRSGSLDLDARLSKVGEATDISAPATTAVLDLGRLRSLAGG
jgi:hypothetical protein